MRESERFVDDVHALAKSLTARKRSPTSRPWSDEIWTEGLKRTDDTGAAAADHGSRKQELKETEDAGTKSTVSSLASPAS